jgi:hypothetical protein
LGDIPRFDAKHVVFYAPIIVHYKAVHGVLGEFSAEGMYAELDFHWDNLNHGNGIKDFQIIASYPRDSDDAVNKAMRAASGARFEHGEKPKGARQ